MSADRISDVPPWASCNHDAPLRSIRARRLHLEPNRMTGAEDFQFSVRCNVQKIIRTPPAVRITSTLRWTNSAARSLMYDWVCKFGGERGNGRKMAFTFGREQTIGSWLRVRPRSFFDWEKTEGVLPPELCDQHKHEEGTPMLLEQATLRNVSRAMGEINGFEWEGDFKPVARQALKELLEKRLEEEMAEYLGVSRYEHATDRQDYRNGHYVRHLLTEMGDLELLVPRSRKGKFPTKLFERYARRCGS